MGFAGLHLDSYGSPKIAWDATGAPVDLAEQLPVFLRMVRATLPASTLIFNNVNDYPTFATAPTPQDATYIEVWDPHREYGHLVSLIDRARATAADKPVILAAYLTPFADDTAERAGWAARLALATVFAHGGHYLLCGEGDGVLTHPYYPKFARLDADSHLLLRRYFDYAVAQGDLLYDPAARDVTRSHLASDENDELQVIADVPVSADPLPGRLWAIARRGGHGMTVHLIDLAAQSDVEWNRGKQPATARRGVQVRLRWPGAAALVGSPEAGPDLRPAATVRDGDYLQAAIPAFRAWATVHFPPHREDAAGQA
jgi:dextranase